MVEKFVSFNSEYLLKGTLTVPEESKEKFPGLLIISGSGQGDRDGNVKGIEINVYKELAEFFTSLGFVTLRYDKRGTHESEGDYHETGVWDLIDDATAAVRFLKEQPQVDPNNIVILGHSEGAIIAPAVHKKEEVNALILLAGFFGPSKEMLSVQNTMAQKEVEEAKGFKGFLFRILKVSDKLKKNQEEMLSKVMSSDEPVIKYKGTKLNAKWMRESQEFNGLEQLNGVNIPVLAVTGDKDVQVPPTDVKNIEGVVKGDAEWHIVPNMNHLLRKYEQNHTILGLMKEYKTLVGQPTDPDLIRILKNWVTKHIQK
ncbi:alpha/beta hydrolase family protein [Cytobacillus sp. FJAT-54145]|uniref:Alpha/beta hydrolase family protein n=1 Tax=Cytobacillus spartinae TaxID=3299023 RepID=A0ABW6KJS3_9BACI